MASPPVARTKIDAYGFEWLLEQLEAGRSIRHIALEIGTSAHALYDYLTHDEERSARTRSALEAGAQAYELQAMQILEEAREEIKEHPQISSAIVALARERAQTCWRQASVRDRRYTASRQGDINIDARTQQVKSLTIIGVPSRGGVHRPIEAGGSQEVGVLPSTKSEVIENAVFPARAVEKDKDWLVVTNIPTLRDIK